MPNQSSRRPALAAALLILMPAFATLLTSPVAGAFGENATPTFSFSSPSTGGAGAAEPSIGSNWLTGNAMFQDFATTWRVVYDDSTNPPVASWQSVTPTTSITNIDPILATDSQRGRTFAGGLNGPCSVLSYSDNDGQSWNQMTNACADPAVDHETIGAGPWKEPRPLGASHDRATYYCAQTSVAQCAASLDGGVTFGAGIPVQCGYINPGLHGSVHVGTDGYVYLPFKDGQGQICVSVSADNGQSWVGRKIPSTTAPVNGFDPDVATTPSGWTWVGYPDGSGKAHASLSKDHGATWTKSPDLGASYGLTVTTFHEMLAGDDNRAAVAFLGATTGTASDAFSSASYTGVWHLYVAFTYDGGATWTTVKTTNDPVQRGCIWAGGGSNACRNLLDFMDATIDKKGRVLVGFADGCRGACANAGGTVGQSRDDFATIARQATGRGLFAAYDQGGPLPLSVSAGGPYAGTVGAAIGLGGLASGGTTPYTYSWSVTAKPAGSSAGAASFSNVNSATPTFTPDVAGAYTLSLSVTDAASQTASASASLTASSGGGGGGTCAAGGTTINQDSASDSLSADSGAEALCLRADDDATTLDLYLDLEGTDITLVNSNGMYWDFWFTADYAAGATLLISVYDDGSGPVATYQTPDYVPIPGKVATAAFEGNTLHVSTARSELFSPANGDTLSGVFVDINQCTGATTCGLVNYDYVPDAQNGVYTFGGSGGGGIPIPLCSVELSTDSATDSTAPTPGKGRRELTRLGASDDDAFTVCFDAADFADAPSGSGVLANTRFSVSWTAAYEGPGISYSMRGVFTPAGDVASSALLKGVGGVSGGALAPGQNVEASVSGNRVLVSVPKSDIGDPADGSQATAIIATVGNDNTGNGALYDRIPNTGSIASFTFGQTLSDTTPPSQVTGLAVSDPGTGNSLNLAWNAATDNTGVVSYLVERSTSAGGPYATVGTPSGTGFSDGGLTSGTTYYYVVKAKDAGGNVGAASTEASGTPTIVVDTTPPTAPGGLTVDGTTAATIAVTWSAASDPESGVASYNLYLDGAAAGSTNSLAHTFSSLQPDTAYVIGVSAVNGEGLESTISLVTASTLPLPPPDCGQTGFQVATDSDFDTANDQLRSDLVRISFREASGRLYAHYGTRGQGVGQTATTYRMTFLVADQLYTVIGYADDATTGGIGVYTSVEVEGVITLGPRTSTDVTATRLCDSVILSFKYSDVGSPASGASMSGLFFESASNTTNAPTIFDRAPDAGTTTFTVGSSNLPPVLAAIGDRAVLAESTLAFTVSATDANGDTLAYSATGLPSGASFNTVTREFTWTPTEAQSGANGPVHFEVSDGQASDSEDITITVTVFETAPILDPIGDRTVAEGGTLAFVATSSDEDGDDATFSLSNAPPGASIDEATGAFLFSPGFAAGHADQVHANVRIEVTDGATVAFEEFTITVTDVDRAPVLAPIGNKATAEGTALSFSVGASDADGDSVAVGATGLPGGATFDGTTFGWTPAVGDAGNYPVTFTATAGALSDAEDITITVGNINRPPDIVPIPAQTVSEASTLTFGVAASDPDAGDTVSLSASGMPAGATFNTATGTFSWTPSFTQAGPYTVTFTASDGDLLTTADANILVENVDRAPTLGALSSRTLVETGVANIALSASDLDGDAVTFSSPDLPAWATLTNTGANAGNIQLAPQLGDKGVHVITVVATSNALSATGTSTVTVLLKTDVSLARIGPAIVKAKPLEVKTLTATVTNTGPQLDTFRFTRTSSAPWTLSMPADVTLAPGDSTTVTLTASVPAGAAGSAITLSATSLGNPSVSSALATWTIDVPILVTVTMDSPTYTLLDTVTGSVTATWYDLTPIAGATVRVKQTPAMGGAAFASQVAGFSDATGTYAFDFGGDAKSLVPGDHGIVATVVLGTRAMNAQAAYKVGL